MGFIEEYLEIFKISHPHINGEMDKLDKISSLYDYYGIKHEEGTYLERDIKDYLMNRIPDILECADETELNSSLIRKIRDHLLLKYFFEGGSLDPIFALDVLFASRLYHSKNIIPFTDKEKWNEAIEMVKDFNILSGSYIKSSSQLKKESPRIFNLGKAAKYFRDNGYGVRIEYGEVIINETDLKKICDEINKYMRLLGGINVTYTILNRLYYVYDDNLERFQFNRTNGFGESQLIPVGYLLNTAVKYPNLTQIDNESMWNYYFHYLIEMSCHLCSIYNVQPYSNIQLMFMGSIFEFIREIALFDSIFTLTQLRPSDVPRILNGLFSNIDQKEMETELGFNLNQLTEIINRIFILATNNKKPLIFDKEYLEYKGSADVLNKVLDTLSETDHDVNKDFFYPTDKPNIIFKPLIKVKDRYVLFNKSWCSPAFFEALTSEMRKSKLEKFNVGIELENFIKTELNKNKIKFNSGHYKMGDVEGDCDVIVESKDTIVLFEVKRKSLTRASQTGDDTSLILDFSKSLLHAQLQAGKHETLLRKYGYIEFDDGSRLECNDRIIERVALTLLDYGGFQDRRTINHLLKRMSSVTFSTRMSKYESDFEKLKEKTDELKEQSKILAKYDKSFTDSPFFDCWFLSLPQLLIMIDDSNDNESFIEQLRKVKQIGFLSLDWYFEYGKLKKI